MQGKLFDLGHPDMPPIFHTEDPPTSQAAADRHAKSGARQHNAAIVLRLVREFPGRTATELWQAASEADQTRLVEMQEVRRRLTDLAHAGKVVQGAERVCAVRGSRMVTWAKAEDG